MKKRLILLTVFLLLFAAFALAEGDPEAFTSGDYGYILTEEDTAVITSFGGADDELIIPDALDGHTVTGIGDNAFAGSSMTKVSIPKSVTGIGIAAFSGCAELTEVEIPEGVTEIPIAAFAECVSLTKVVIPAGVVSIGDSAFAGCLHLAEMELPDGLTSIGPYAFPGSGLIKLKIPDSVTFIGEGAFSWCGMLSRVTLPASIPGLDLNAVFQDVLPDIKFTVPADSDSAELCRMAGVVYITPKS